MTTKTIKDAGFDDDLTKFAAEGGAPLPVSKDNGHVEHDNARIWYTTYGQEPGIPVILLHGSLGHGGNWGYQVPALVEGGYRVIVIDSRGHGRSTRDDRPFTYQLMASDVLAVMDTLHLDKASFLGWSDGAVISMCVAMKTPNRVNGVIFYACNVDPSGVFEIFDSPLLGRCFGRHSKDYASLSSTPGDFKQFAAVMDEMMSTQPNFTKDDLSKIDVPFVIMQSEKDEFIKMEHAEYLAKTIPSAKLVVLKDVTHFAPLQRPSYFNDIILNNLKQFK